MGEWVAGEPELPTLRHLLLAGESLGTSLSAFNILSTIGGKGSLSSGKFTLDVDIGLDADPVSDLLLAAPLFPMPPA
jgi:hypothetical protein